jgi:hypothetical protein
MRASSKDRAVLAGLAFVASLGLTACEGAPAPLRPTATAYRGQKARVFPNQPQDVWDAACATLREQGFVLREDEAERGFIHAHTILGPEALGSAPVGPQAWTRVTARIDFIDHHKRAPRTLLEVEASRHTGSADGPIEASVEALEVDFYERFFQTVEQRLPVPALPQLTLPGLE